MKLLETFTRIVQEAIRLPTEWMWGRCLVVQPYNFKNEISSHQNLPSYTTSDNDDDKNEGHDDDIDKHFHFYRYVTR